MQSIYVFLIENDVWILFLCALGITWYVIQFFSRNREYRRSAFRMERDRAINDRNRAVLYLAIFFSIVALIGYVDINIAPTLPLELFDPPTPEIVAAVATVSGTLAPPPTPIRFPTATIFMVPTATLRDPSLIPGTLQTRVPTPAVELEVEIVIEGCESPARIDEPASGSTVSGGMSIFGRATVPNFNYYNVEIKGPQTNDKWDSLLNGAVNAPVENGFLGSASVAGWETGIYQVRLVVVDSENNEAGSCLIQIGIQE